MSITIKTVADHAGVSAQTVSRVLRGHGYASEPTRLRVLAAVEAVGYRPNAVGRSLRATRTPIVGLLITDIRNPFYAIIHKSSEAVFRQQGLTVMLLNSDDDAETELQQLELVSSYRPSALLLTPAVNSVLTAKNLAPFDNVILISRVLPGVVAPAVLTNERDATQEATQALLNAGHRHVVAILGPLEASTTQNREAGYRTAMGEAGGEPVVVYTDQTTVGARAAMSGVLRARPELTGIIGFNVPVTEGILLGCRDEGRKLPRDMSLIGFSDAPSMESHEPPISVVQQPVEAMGQLAAKLILDLIEGRHVDNGPHVVPSNLVMRKSVSRPRH